MPTRATGDESIESCLSGVPDDHTAGGEGVQHLVASTGIRIDDVEAHPMAGTKLPWLSFSVALDAAGRRRPRSADPPASGGTVARPGGVVTPVW
ncbi:hypothetical protein GCM10010123_02550 [Pilimelia anulata]|uniref:Uncharacterized protein n=1 Tax=Pilimelia anulata TaxID=53371 RepID=A0A8J3B1D7_9ACTN|nr:hypothetical protein [Pilimelia anulata]GGJ76060.1 hypothetical protein GCM10010123_02550 [Pilimelia anulata]